MLKHSITNRMVGRLHLFFFVQNIGFCTMLIVTLLENPEGVITVRREEKKVVRNSLRFATIRMTFL